MSLPSRGVWIEIFGNILAKKMMASLPSRGVWIEMPLYTPLLMIDAVAPLAGSVD